MSATAKRTRRPYTKLDRDVTLSDGNKPLLTREEEIELGRRVQAGDKSAIDELVVRNLRLAVDHSLKRKPTASLGLDDLASTACFGLIEAAKRYDPERDIRFSTYASYWIRCFIGNALQDNRGELRVPRHAQFQLSRLRKAERSHGELLIDSEEVRSILGITPKQQRLMIAANAAFSASAMKINVVDGENEDQDNTVDPAPDACERIETEETNASLHAAINRLSPIQRQVIRRRFFGGETLKTVGASLGITRERVRQIESEGIKRLRAMLEKEGPEEARPPSIKSA